MALGLIGKKLGMMKVYTDKGEAIAVTVVDVSGNSIIQVKQKSGKDGYSAVQVGYGDQKEFRVTKPLLGHFKKNGSTPKKVVKEFRLTSDEQLPAADAKIDASLFSAGQWVDVIGVTRGRGFSGAMRRHNFSGQPASHGAKRVHRKPGSIGASADPSRVLPGTRMPGHYGCEQVTSRNLKVVRLDGESNVVLVRGAVPGPSGAFVVIRRSAKN